MINSFLYRQKLINQLPESLFYKQLSPEHCVEVVEHLCNLDEGGAGFGRQLVVVAAHDALFYRPGHSGLGVGTDLRSVGEGIYHRRVVHGGVIPLIHRKTVQEHRRLLACVSYSREKVVAAAGNDVKNKDS